jgi:arylsulfatase A-like enzyme
MLLFILLCSIVLLGLAAARYGWSVRLAWVALAAALGGVVSSTAVAAAETTFGDASLAASTVKLAAIAAFAAFAAAIGGVRGRWIVAYGLPALAFSVFGVAASSGPDYTWMRAGFWALLGSYAVATVLLSHRPQTIGAGAVLSLGVWFALATSLVELAWRSLRLRIFSAMRLLESMDSLVYLPRDGYWAAPAANLAVFAILAGLLAAAGRLHPRLASRSWVLFVYCWTSSLAVFSSVLEWLSPWFVQVYALGMALGLQSKLQGSFDGFQRWVARTQPILAAAVLACAVAVPLVDARREQATVASLPSGVGGRKNVLLIVLDTARKASFSGYGYERPTTPNLDRFARRGVVFENAITNSSWTLPSHASIFTGRWCSEHNAGFLDPLDRRFPTLAEALAGEGYETVGFVSNTGCCGRHTGLGRGFLRFEDHPTALELLRLNSLATRIVLGTPNWLIRPAENLVGEFLDWHGGRDRSRPFFAFVNLLDPHFPYRVQDAAFDKYASAPAEQKRRIRDRWANFPEEYHPFEREEIELALDTYDGSIEYMDHHVGRLLDALERSGDLAETLVVVANDHGEHFGEKGLFLHGTSLYRPLIDAPLIVSPPGGRIAESRVSAPVGLQEIPKTVLTFIGAARAEEFPGESWTHLWEGRGERRLLRSPPIFSQLGEAVNIQGQINSDSIVYSVVADGYHYIQSHNGRNEEIYDFDADPANELNLIATPEGREAAARLSAMLEANLAQARASSTGGRGVGAWPEIGREGWTARASE